MICKYCGYEHPDTIPVCPNCGRGSKAFTDNEPEALKRGAATEKDAPSAAVRESIPELKPFLDTDPVPGERKSKKKTGSKGRRGRKTPRLIVLGILLAALVAGGIVFRHYVAEFFLYTFSSPEKYYQHVEERAISDYAEAVGDVYALLRNQDPDGGSAKMSEYTITAEASLKELSVLKSLLDEDYAWIDSVRVEANAQAVDSDAQASGSLLVNDVKAIDANLNYSDGDLSVQLPEISEDYLLLNDSEQNGLWRALLHADLTRDEVVSLTSKLLTAAVQQLDEVSKERGSLEAQDISQRSRILHVTISERDRQEIADAVKAVLNSAPEAKKLVSAAAEETGMDEAELVDALVGSIFPEDADGAGVMDVYVGLDGSVIGRTISADDDSFLFRSAHPISISERAAGLEVELRRDSTFLRVEGRLEEESGDLDVYFDTQENPGKLMTVQYSDLKNEDDALSVTVNVSFGDGLAKLLQRDAVRDAIYAQFGKSDTTRSVVDALQSQELGLALKTLTLDGKLDSGETTELGLRLSLADMQFLTFDLSRSTTDAEELPEVGTAYPYDQWSDRLHKKFSISSFSDLMSLSNDFPLIKLIETFLPRALEIGVPDSVIKEFLDQTLSDYQLPGLLKDLIKDLKIPDRLISSTLDGLLKNIDVPVEGRTILKSVILDKLK